MYGFLYITTNSINGKQYLGMCKFSKNNHESYLGSGKHLKKAIKKYGIQNFTRETIYIAETKDDLSQKEIEYIKKFNCVNDRNWYNIAPGGYSTRGFSGRKHTDSTKEKMRKNHKRILTEEGRKRIGDSARKRIHKYRVCYSGADHGKSIPITINGVTYGSLGEAGRMTGLSRYHIRKIKAQSCD